MSEARYEAVDLDRLADYLGGALDGTPDADAVADLIGADPEWGAAYAALVSADSAVRADLRVLATASEPVPADLAARIDAALRPLPVPAGQASRLTLVRDEPAPSRTPGSSTPGSSHRRPRSRRWAVALAAAAAVVACGLGAVTVLPQLVPDSGRTTALRENDGPKTADDASRPGTSDLGAPSSAGGAPRLVASGSDYTPDTLRGLAARTTPDNVPSAGIAGAPGAPDTVPGGVPDELRRLREPAARQACLGAIVREYGGTVGLVDYARFEGRPALLVLLVGASGRPGSWIVVVGPDCGLGGAIADERYNGPAG